MMRLQGKRVSYHDITDFVPGHVVENERFPLAGSLGQLVLETGPKKPPLHKVTLSQWNCANTSILDTLIQEGSITGLTFQIIWPILRKLTVCLIDLNGKLYYCLTESTGNCRQR